MYSRAQNALTDTCVCCARSASFSALFFYGVLAGVVLGFFPAAAAGEGESGVKASGHFFGGIVGKVILGRG